MAPDVIAMLGTGGIGQAKVSRQDFGGTVLLADNIGNPLNAVNRVQGAAIDGLSVALDQQTAIEAGHVVESNFDTYP